MIRIACALLALGCVEPTAVSKLESVPTIETQESPVSRFAIDPVGRTVYVRFAGLQEDGREPVYVLIRRMFYSADSISANRLIVDLRAISGVDAKLLVPLIRGIMSRERFMRAGALYVVVGPESFSPAQNAASLLAHYASPIVVQQLQWSF